jgi:hypothetical protein
MYYQYYIPPPSPEPLKSGVFTYDENGIKAGGFTRATFEELRLLFRKNASSARVRSATKPWVTAQLHLYGIPFRAKASAAELKSALETAVKNRQVRKADLTTMTWEWTDRPSA